MTAGDPDDRTARSIRLIVAYDPQPPYGAGPVRSAPPEPVSEWRTARGKA